MAEPHPDMNIKVAAFTESEKSSNTCISYTMTYDTRSCDLYILKYATMLYVIDYVESLAVYSVCQIFEEF